MTIGRVSYPGSQGLTNVVGFQSPPLQYRSSSEGATTRTGRDTERRPTDTVFAFTETHGAEVSVFGMGV
jgi:hypothetical protein